MDVEELRQYEAQKLQPPPNYTPSSPKTTAELAYLTSLRSIEADPQYFDANYRQDCWRICMNHPDGVEAAYNEAVSSYMAAFDVFLTDPYSPISRQRLKDAALFKEVMRLCRNGYHADINQQRRQLEDQAKNPTRPGYRFIPTQNLMGDWEKLEEFA